MWIKKTFWFCLSEHRPTTVVVIYILFILISKMYRKNNAHRKIVRKIASCKKKRSNMCWKCWLMEEFSEKLGYYKHSQHFLPPWILFPPNYCTVYSKRGPVEANKRPQIEKNLSFDKTRLQHMDCKALKKINREEILKTEWLLTRVMDPDSLN